MNIEEILPELFGEKRIYYCQRCLNHGLDIKRKNHKADCIYRFCTCNDCQMVDRRRELNSRLLQIETTSPPSSITETTTDMHLILAQSASSPQSTKGKERRPNCQRCAQHFVQARLKGHKRCCPFRDCPCAKCQVVQERQKLMADQIKLRRKQKKQKTLDAIIDMDNANIPISTFINIRCMKCTQQLFGYQHLLSLVDPSMILDPALISTILAAYTNGNQSDL
ncbi:unnamed protein product [Dracunculus medinensis]|uniref:DM domain-containing protein n=1 Tax=Dracunculus medinensis TaxID=318479 RepID=A0A0N4U132_DRAME|nr:unnamed protein product [Dracunculus medinensis]